MPPLVASPNNVTENNVTKGPDPRPVSLEALGRGLEQFFCHFFGIFLQSAVGLPTLCLGELGS